MAELKTKLNNASVTKFLDGVKEERKRKDCYSVLNLMKEITKEEPKMWGASIVGFGSYHYVYASGREGDWPITGFSPRKQNLTLYIMSGFKEYPDLMKKVGNHSTGSSCLYIKKLDDINLPVLKQLIRKCVAHMKKKYKPS